MTFIGTRHVITEPIVIPTLSSNQLLHTFFTNDNNRNLLFPNNNAISLNLLEYLTAKKMKIHEIITTMMIIIKCYMILIIMKLLIDGGKKLN